MPGPKIGDPKEPTETRRAIFAGGAGYRHGTRTTPPIETIRAADRDSLIPKRARVIIR